MDEEPVKTGEGKALSEQFNSDSLAEMQKKTPLLGSFIHLLQASNNIREKIEAGDFDGFTSEEAFNAFWNLHTGETYEEQALAFAEEGGLKDIDEWVKALKKGKKPTGVYKSVREFEGLPPMLFDLPDPPKAEVAKLLFEFADKLLDNPDSIKGNLSAGAYIPAVLLQTFTNFIHPKIDSNGRTSEEWMLWWQRRLIQNAEAQAKKRGNEDSIAFFLDIEPKPAYTQDGLRAWYHHGLRARCSSAGDHSRPGFLKDEYGSLYIQGRQLMDNRTLSMNAFRREMYEFLSGELGFSGKPQEFEQYIRDNQERTVGIFQNLFTDPNELSHTLNKGDFTISDFVDLLGSTGSYEYEQLTPSEVIKPEYLASMKYEVV